jgi:hypothetical protein
MTIRTPEVYTARQNSGNKNTRRSSEQGVCTRVQRVLFQVRYLQRTQTPHYEVSMIGRELTGRARVQVHRKY